jgi:hypothetical protein
MPVKVMVHQRTYCEWSTKMNSFRIKRRRFIELLAIGSAGLASSCRLFTRKPPILCLDLPELQDPDAPLAIDVHAHVFNASDLQVEGFVSLIAVNDSGGLGDLARFFGAILQRLGWKVAPSVDEEMQILQEVSSELCTSKEAQDRFYEVRNRQYQKTRAAIREFAPVYRSEVNERMPMAESQERSALQNELFGLDTALIALPDTYEKFQDGETDGASRQFSQRQVGLRSALDFLIEQFQYRVSSTARYFDDYNTNSKLKVDLMCPSMVDYDWWIAGGDETEKSPLTAQVELHKELAILSGGRVHAFVPFDPFKEAMHREDNSLDSSFKLVKDAIGEKNTNGDVTIGKGAIGVKLYPPMGFAALGNATQDVWKDKTWLTDLARDPRFGQLLDDAMRDLFTWCLEQDVPIMAHTNITNTPHDDFLPLVGPEFWTLALDEFPGLRLNFAHFGGAGSKGFESDRVRKFLELMADPTRGANAFADASYFTRLLEDPQVVNEGLQTLFDSDFGIILRSRLMYGSDWKMLLLEKFASDYLRRFNQVISDLSPGDSQLQTGFFGRNAAAFLGLQQGNATRRRLEQFYSDNNVDSPPWMAKIDQLS